MTDVSTINLPPWARYDPTVQVENRVPVVEVDGPAAYEAWLEELGSPQVDQYWLEVAYQCIKLDLQLAMRTFAFEIRISDPEKRFAQVAHPVGKGSAAASRGLEGREHFRRLRGFVPA